MGEFFHAVRVFFDQLASVSWAALAIALALAAIAVLAGYLLLRG